MFIKALTVEGVGRFGTAAHVNGFDEGVNVLAAGNEAGKSTLFKAIRMCLFCRHDSKAQEIRDLAADESQLPLTIELTFVDNGRTYVIKKSFLRSPSASLTEDGREIARSKQADEAVWQILGLSPGSGRSLDDGAFGLLWVGQGASFTSLVPGPTASSMLSAVIESEVGALVGGERARQVLEGVTAAVTRYLTDSGQRPKADGPLHRALANAERWQAAETESQKKLAALDAQFTELVAHRRRYSELTDAAASQQIAQEFVEAKNSLAEAQSVAQDIRRLEAEEVGARRGRETAAQRLQQHRDVATRIDANRVAETALAGDLADLEAREREARTAVGETQGQITSVEEGVQSLAPREQLLDKLAAAAVRAQRRDDLARQIEILERAAGALRETDAQLSQICVKAKTVEELDELERQVASLKAQLSAAAAHLAIGVNAEGLGHVRVGDVLAPESYSAPVLGPISIKVGTLAEITVTPAANPRHKECQELAERLSATLSRCGVTTTADARALLSKRRDLEATRKVIIAQLKTLKVDEDPEPTVAKLKRSLAETDAVIAAALADTQRDRMPTIKEFEQERLALSQERTSLEARRASFEATRKEQQTVLEGAVEARSAAGSKLDLIRRGLVDDEALCPRDDRPARGATLVAAVTSAETAHQTALTALNAIREAAPDLAEIERRETRCKRLEQALANRADELRQLERDIGRLTGQIQSAGGDGVGENLALAQEQRLLAERECARIQARVASLQLLRDTIARCLAEGREQYYGPVRRHLRPFLDDLFPGSELELGDDFAIAGIKRHRSEPFTRLSDGTQEQIAVLVRLALGAMLAERGQVVPIILDDALVYCDDDRIQRMFDALTRAGRHQQIIVLTCRLRSFAALGGHMLRVHYPGGGVTDLQRLLLQTKRELLPSSASKSAAEIGSGSDGSKSRTLR